MQHNKEMDKRLHPPLPQERQPQNDYRGITLNAIAAKVYNALFWRCPWCNGYRRRKWTR